jgi:hypothetical protein
VARNCISGRKVPPLRASVYMASCDPKAVAYAEVVWVTIVENRENFMKVRNLLGMVRLEDNASLLATGTTSDN